MPYNREGRRVSGITRLNINHIKQPYDYTVYRTGIAVGDYPVDHHHAQYKGKVPPIPFPPIPSFNIPLGSLIPADVKGLIVADKGISVSNIVNGTTRLQPVVLLTGQAAGILAADCIQKQIQPFQIKTFTVQQQLLQSNCYIMPFCDIHPLDSCWKAAQVCGITGIIKGTGKSEGWSNKTFFYPDSIMRADELIANLSSIFKINLKDADSFANKTLTTSTLKK